MAPPDTSDFDSAAYDSAWFTAYEPAGLRLVITTGKEAVLRGQRGLLRWLQRGPRELYMTADDGSVHRINWPGSGTPAAPGDKTFTPDAAIGPVTLEVLAEFASEHRHAGELADIEATIAASGHRLKDGVLSELLRAGWNADVQLPPHTRLPAFNRRPPTPRGRPVPLPQAAAEIRAADGGNATPVLTRDGVATSDVSWLPPPAPSEIAPAGQVAGGVDTVERSHDSLAPLTADEGMPRGTKIALFVLGVAVVGAGTAVALWPK